MKQKRREEFLTWAGIFRYNEFHNFKLQTGAGVGYFSEYNSFASVHKRESFSKFYCAGMLKQNHWKEAPMCAANNEIHRTKRIIAFQERTRFTNGEMFIPDCRK